MNAPAPLRSNAQPTPGLPVVGVTDDAPVCDTSLKFVRVLEERSDGLVDFEFSIGWPELAVELLLPAPAFAEFCATQRVQRLGD
ncbi:MAG: phenol hydroxylase [Burkholderiaceae bacterium]|nr:MAG: phenol hydroxylase [Burkholderiaceae bacterium]